MQKTIQDIEGFLRTNQYKTYAKFQSKRGTWFISENNGLINKIHLGSEKHKNTQREIYAQFVVINDQVKLSYPFEDNVDDSLVGYKKIIDFEQFKKDFEEFKTIAGNFKQLCNFFHQKGFDSRYIRLNNGDTQYDYFKEIGTNSILFNIDDRLLNLFHDGSEQEESLLRIDYTADINQTLESLSKEIKKFEAIDRKTETIETAKENNSKQGNLYEKFNNQEDDNFIKKYKLKYVIPSLCLALTIISLAAIQLSVQLTLEAQLGIGIGGLLLGLTIAVGSKFLLESMENNKSKNVTNAGVVSKD